jgi:hypothetical protein
MPIITDDVIVELDGKECLILKGSPIMMKKPENHAISLNSFVVEDDIELNLDGDRILVEHGDIIELADSGKSLDSDIRLVAGDESYLFEKGDKISINEGFMDYIKYVFDPSESRAFIIAFNRVRKGLTKALQLIVNRYRWLDRIDNAAAKDYEQIIQSDDFRALAQLLGSKTSQELQDNLIITNVNPLESMRDIQSAIDKMGDTAIADQFEKAVHPGILGKFTQSLYELRKAADLDIDDKEESPQTPGDDEVSVGGRAFKLSAPDRERLNQILAQDDDAVDAILDILHRVGAIEEVPVDAEQETTIDGEEAA